MPLCDVCYISGQHCFYFYIMETRFYNDWRIVLLAAVSFGLAPFIPEPHIWGKVKWIAGGAVGMKGMDWFDFFMHGIPWFMLIRIGILKLLKRL